MPYIDTEDVAKIRKGIRAALPDYKISVRKHHHSGVDVTVLSGPISNVEHVNVFWYKDNLRADKENRPDAIELIDRILAEIFKVKQVRVEVEDGDYGTVPNFYYDVSFGAWDKPYVCTDPDAEDRLEIKRAFTKIVEERKYQASRQTCGMNTLAPDDLVIPCVLPVGHVGFCDTGR